MDNTYKLRKELQEEVPILKKYPHSMTYQIVEFIEKKRKEGKCVHCGTKKQISDKFDAIYCPRCLYWTEKICPDRNCDFCKDRPKYPRKNQR